MRVIIKASNTTIRTRKMSVLHTRKIEGILDLIPPYQRWCERAIEDTAPRTAIELLRVETPSAFGVCNMDIHRARIVVSRRLTSTRLQSTFERYLGELI